MKKGAVFVFNCHGGAPSQPNEHASGRGWTADSKLDSENWTFYYLNERPSFLMAFLMSSFSGIFKFTWSKIIK